MNANISRFVDQLRKAGYSRVDTLEDLTTGIVSVEATGHASKKDRYYKYNHATNVFTNHSDNDEKGGAAR